MEQKERIIFHIDVNSAFLSWESVYRLSQDPDALDLRTIPSAVGGDQKSRHGIILAKSTPENMASQPENLSPRRFANARILFWSHPVLNFIPSARMP